MYSETNPKKERVLLLHGAWQGSWAWSRFLPYLDQAGIDYLTIDLPGNGSDATALEDVCLEVYVEHLEKILQADCPARVALVAHSGSGVIATELAERFPQRISRIAYIAGMMLPPGMTFGDLLTEMQAAENGLEGIETFLKWTEDGAVSEVSPEHGAAVFLNDMEPSEAIKLASQLTPQATRGLALSANWTAERFGTVPRLYIECSRDLSVKLPVQREMQKQVPGAERFCLDCGHAPQASTPAILAKVLIPFLQRSF